MTPTSVDRCIAVAAHGRRCQQTTYRGSPYCWHHTQSRKVWAPSRMSAARTTRRTADAGPMPRTEVPILAGEAVVDERALLTATALARVLDASQLDALQEFLRRDGTGVFRIDKVEGAVTRAEVDRRMGRSLRGRGDDASGATPTRWSPGAST